MGRFGGRKEKGKLCDYNIKNVFLKRSLTLAHGSAAYHMSLTCCLSVCMYTYAINNSSRKSLIQKEFLPQRPLWITHPHSVSCLLQIPHLQPFGNFGKSLIKQIWDLCGILWRCPCVSSSQTKCPILRWAFCTVHTLPREEMVFKTSWGWSVATTLYIYRKPSLGDPWPSNHTQREN